MQVGSESGCKSPASLFLRRLTVRVVHSALSETQSFRLHAEEERGGDRQREEDRGETGGRQTYICLLGLAETRSHRMPAGSVSDSAPLLFQFTLGRRVLGDETQAGTRTHTQTHAITQRPLLLHPLYVQTAAVHQTHLSHLINAISFCYCACLWC